MTLGSFVVRNAFRNKRRSLLTMISIGFSLLLLTLMICIWRSFYVDQVAPEAARRVIIRDRVSLAFFLPAYYRDKIRSSAGSNRRGADDLVWRVAISMTGRNTSSLSWRPIRTNI